MNQAHIPFLVQDMGTSKPKYRSANQSPLTRSPTTTCNKTPLFPLLPIFTSRIRIGYGSPYLPTPYSHELSITLLVHLESAVAPARLRTSPHLFRICEPLEVARITGFACRYKSAPWWTGGGMMPLMMMGAESAVRESSVFDFDTVQMLSCSRSFLLSPSQPSLIFSFQYSSQDHEVKANHPFRQKNPFLLTANNHKALPTQRWDQKTLPCPALPHTQVTNSPGSCSKLLCCNQVICVAQGVEEARSSVLLSSVCWCVRMGS